LEEHVASIFRVEEYTKQETSIRQAASEDCCLLHAGFMLGSLFNPEDGGGMFLLSVRWLSMVYKMLCLRSRSFSWPVL
jgi:hypothetical protein